MKPDLLAISEIEWQLFATFTFQKEVSERIRVQMFFSALRRFARGLDLHFATVLWALRREHGELTGRFHFHALIGGLPPFANRRSLNFMLMQAWERQGGGMARVYRYNPQLDGAGYILKATESMLSRQAGAYYETCKFGAAEVTLSMSLVRAIGKKLVKGGDRG